MTTTVGGPILVSSWIARATDSPSNGQAHLPAHHDGFYSPLHPTITFADLKFVIRGSFRLG